MKKTVYIMSNVPFRGLSKKRLSKDIGFTPSKRLTINNLEKITCFSNEGNKWRNSKISFIEKNTLEIKISEKFVGERGRINCSLREGDGFWRWLGIQFVISEK